MYRDTILLDRPNAYFRLGEASGITAGDELSHYPGTYSGSPTLGVTGALSGDSNSAAQFNGTSQAMSASTVPVTAPTLTLECWAKTLGGTGTLRTILALGPSARIVALPTDNYAFQVKDGGVFSSVQGSDVAATYSHIVGTFDGTYARLYINGNYESRIAIVSPNLTGSGLLVAALFNGVVDEVAVYNYPLSPAQVLRHYDEGQSISTPTIIAGRRLWLA